jgi:hypothetical protein
VRYGPSRFDPNFQNGEKEGCKAAPVKRALEFTVGLSVKLNCVSTGGLCTVTQIQKEHSEDVSNVRHTERTYTVPPLHYRMQIEYLTRVDSCASTSVLNEFPASLSG